MKNKKFKIIIFTLVLFVLFAFAPTENKIRIFMIGDSTMAEIGYTSQDYQGYPRGGWGMALQAFFDKDNVEIHNYALAGRRTDTYYSESKGWGTVLPQLGPGDVLFIQFGHNEVSNAYGSYKDYLEKFCDEAIAKGAQPVLLTPINRCSFNDDGTMYNTLGDYPDATRQLAAERDDVPLIDLHLRTKIRFEELGEDYTRWNIYSNIKPGIYPTWPNGRTDGTHLLLEGAWEISNMVREAIIEKQDVPIFQKLRPYLNKAGIVWVLPEPNMSGTFSTWGTCVFPEGTQIEIVPAATGDLPFSAWKKDGVVVSGAPTYTYTVTDKKFELTGYFGEDLNDCNGDLGGTAFIDECGQCVSGNTGKTACIPVDYTLSTSVNGQGSVSPSTGEYREGSEVTLTATGTVGWAFDNWSGDTSGTDNPIYVTMDTDKSITANFVEVPTYSISTTVNGNGNISPASGIYSEGDIVIVTAIPDAGYAFESWGGDIGGSTNPVTITMDANKSISATFIESPVPPALISLGFNDNSGSSVSNSGTVSATFSKTDPPAWSTNVPANGGASSVDFGTGEGNYYIESSSIISELAGLSSFTITGWVNNRSSSVGSGGNRIVSWINNGGNGVDLVYDSDGSLTMGINQWPDHSNAVSSSDKITTDASAAASNWRFFAVTYDASLASGNVNFYFGDNTNAASLDKTISYSQGAVGLSIGKLAIGHFNDESSRTSRTNRMFRGLIDQVNIFGGVLTLAEIQAAQSSGVITNTFSLSTSVSGPGHVSPANGTFNEGEVVSITATPDDGWEFNNWGGDASGSDNPLLLTMDTNKTVTAYFAEIAKFNLTSTVNGNGSISPASGSYSEGGAVSITATPDTGWAFDSWSGDASGTSNPLSLTMDANKSITANFVEVPAYSLTSVINGNGSISPASGTYDGGTVVSIAATANAGWVFDSWGGDASGSANPLSLTMDANKTISATFIESPVPPALISLGFNDNSGSSVANSGTVPATFSKTDPPAWSTNVPVNGGAGSVDFGTSYGNYYVESGATISQLAGLSSFTVTGWVNNRSSSVGSGGNRIVSWIKNGGNGVDIVYNSDGSMTTGINQWPDRGGVSSNSGAITTDAGAPASNWKFFAVTYNGSNVSFYFGDNTTAASLDKTVSYNQGAVGSDIGKLAIGHFNAESNRPGRTNRMFRGLIDQVDIFGSVLSLSEIQTVQNASNSPVPVTGVTVAPASASVNAGLTIQLTPAIEPSNATNQNISWSSGNTSVATVSSSGLVSGVAEGNATITATTEDGSYSATCDITVTNSAVIKICPVGNSITQSNSEHLSYRYPLWKKLIDGGIAFDFVGSQNSNNGGNPVWPDYNGQSFDRDHEGHWGWRANEIRDNIDGWLAGYTPDMALIHIGTNDCYHDHQDAAGIITEITQIIEHLRADNPNVVIFLASLIPCRDVQSYIDALNAEIPGCVNNLNTRQSPVILVDMASVVTSDDLFDGIHPGPTGEEKMAQKWFDAINSYLAGTIPVTGVSVNLTTDSVVVGSTAQLTATVVPSDATNKNVSWGSDNTSVATVSSTGIVTGVAAGTANITVTTADGSYTATSTITVTNIDIPVTGVSVSPTSLQLDINPVCNIFGSGTLTATVGPANATNKNVTWTTSNSSVATVDNSGIVTAAGNGSAIITVTTEDGNKTATCNVNVSTVVPVYSVSISPAPVTLDAGSTTQLTATVLPVCGSQNVSWASGNTSVATVSPTGLVTGVAAGSVTITATTQDGGYTATCYVTVSPVTDVTITLQENEDGFCSVDGSVDNNNAGFTGTGFANTDNVTEKGISWSVDIPSSGTYSLVWRYAHGKTGDRTAQLMVDGTTAVSGISMQPTGSWTTWTETPATDVSLSAGTHTIRLEAANSDGLANIDFMNITGSDPTPVSCTGLKSAGLISGNNREINVTIYPNPVNNTLNIVFSRELAEIVTVNLLDNTGRIVNTAQISGMNYHIDMSGLPNGLYLVKISGSGLNKVMHLVKQ